MLWGLTVVFPQDLSGKESEQGSERCTERKPSRIIQIQYNSLSCLEYFAQCLDAGNLKMQLT